MQGGDILILAVIAAFILLRYRAMLGDKTGRDADSKPMMRILNEYERVVQLPERDAAKASAKAASEAKDEGPFAADFAAMRGLDRNFTVDGFLEGARGAFEMVVEAFNEADRETLKMLLAPSIYAEFDRSLTNQTGQNRFHKTTLVAILESEITKVELTGQTARMTVKFVSEQILLVRDGAGEIVEGDASTQQAVEDHWVFERTLTNTDPAWSIVDT